MTTDRSGNRHVPEGIRAGGQFDGRDRLPADVTLGAAAPADELNLATATPFEVDSKLLEALRDLYRLEHRHELNHNDLHHNMGHRRQAGRWTDILSSPQMADILTEQALDEGMPAYKRHDMNRCVERYREIEAALADAWNQINELDGEYSSRPWRRGYLVVSSSGLVHSSRRCHTCNKGKSSTQFALLPGLSDASPERLAETLGPALCSVCYPDAPAHLVDNERIPGRLVEVLLNDGPEAFEAERTKYKAKAAAAAAARCEGSGKFATERRHPACPDCNQRVTISGNMVIRAHKRPA